MPSMPAILSALSTACGVSIMGITRISAFKVFCASIAAGGRIAELRGRAAGAAMAHRAEAEGVDQATRLLDGIDVRHDDAERAVVERPRAFVERAGADAHDGRHAGGQGGQANLRDLLRRDHAVLGIDEQPVVAGSLGEHRHG